MFGVRLFDRGVFSIFKTKNIIFLKYFREFSQGSKAIKRIRHELDFS